MLLSQLDASEYNPYFKNYIGLVPENDLLEVLAIGLANTNYFFENLPKEKLEYRYAEDKWTPKDILLHLIDCERVFCYRAMHFARTEQANLEGFDENVFALNANANRREIDDLLCEYVAVRTATILMFKGFSNVVLRRLGKANNNLLSVRAAGFIICGHEMHHCNIIKERYL